MAANKPYEAQNWVVFIRFRDKPKVYGPYRRATAQRVAEVMQVAFKGLEVRALVLRKDPTSEL